MRNKYRAWNRVDKEMMYDVCLSSDGSVIDFEYGNFVGTYPKDQVVPLQCTGLRDKNGTEIYEGDIVEEHDDGVYHWVVKWDEECACFYLHEQNIGETFYLDDLVSVVNKGKVIGNIYEMEGKANTAKGLYGEQGFKLG